MNDDSSFNRPARLNPIFCLALLVIVLSAVCAGSAALRPAFALSPCAGAAAGDGALVTGELYHNDTQLAYREPAGAITMGSSATLRLRVCQNDVQKVQVLVWKTGDPLNAPSNTYTATVAGADPSGPYDIWQVAAPAPAIVIDQWYQFRLVDAATTNYYHPASGNTGPGVWSAALQNPSWKLGTKPADYAVPAWMKDAVIYQVFPDRFRNGNVSNDPPAGRTVYGPTTCGGSACVTQLHSSWTDLPTQPGFGIDFFGGDLQGVIDKINAGYFNDLGVNTLYLNPIFSASSNHGYDTNDYYTINPYLGDNAKFDELIAAANAHNLRVILDAVFNHTGADSRYMDGYGLNRWPSDVGACESASSPYRAWFTTGASGQGTCANGWGWKGWYNYETIPELVENDVVKTFFYRGGSPQSPGGVSVTRYWLDKGIAGWRFDVAQDITHLWWQDMRPYVKTSYSQAVMLGEVTGGCDWGLYQSYLNANELDSVMNYCFRDWAVGFANGNAPSSFDTSYNNFRASFPPSPWYAMMNLVSSHDSTRVLNLLSGDKARLKLIVLLQMTLPGAPSVYYGDEVALPGGGDPDNRRPYPWADKGGSPDTAMYAHFKTVIGIRNAHSALRGGDVQTLLADDANKLYSYVRWDATEKIVVALNNGTAARMAAIPVSAYLADGATLTDVLNGNATYTVASGAVSVPVSSQWGVILVAGGASPTPTPTPAGPTPTRTPTKTATPTTVGPTPTKTATSAPTATRTNTPLPPTATSTPASATVNFTVVGYVTSYGQNIYIVGNAPEIGNWNTAQAVKLNWVNSNTWSGPVVFTASRGQTIQYKYIVKNSDGSIIWQPDPNRTCAVPLSGSANVNDTWNPSAPTAIPTAGPTATPTSVGPTPTKTATPRPPTATPTPASVTVNFTVNGYVTSYGQNIYIVGNAPEIGNWNTAQAIKLNWVDSDTWSGPVVFTASRGQTIQYKYIVKNPNGSVIWEGGSNHTCIVPAGGSGSKTDNWQW